MFARPTLSETIPSDKVVNLLISESKSDFKPLIHNCYSRESNVMKYLLKQISKELRQQKDSKEQLNAVKACEILEEYLSGSKCEFPAFKDVFNENFKKALSKTAHEQFEKGNLQDALCTEMVLELAEAKENSEMIATYTNPDNMAFILEVMHDMQNNIPELNEITKKAYKKIENLYSQNEKIKQSLEAALDHDKTAIMQLNQILKNERSGSLFHVYQAKRICDEAYKSINLGFLS